VPSDRSRSRPDHRRRGRHRSTVFRAGPAGRPQVDHAGFRTGWHQPRLPRGPRHLVSPAGPTPPGGNPRRPRPARLETERPRARRPTRLRPRHRLGRRAEALARDHLTAAGLMVVAHNWRCRHGEIDLVATAPGLVVFCEVKARRSDAYGTPAAAVTARKQARLRALAAAWLAAADHPPSRVRFDVVTVTWPKGSVSAPPSRWPRSRGAARLVRCSGSPAKSTGGSGT
jgi:putative endonuclease